MDLYVNQTGVATFGKGIQLVCGSHQAESALIDLVNWVIINNEGSTLATKVGHSADVFSKA